MSKKSISVLGAGSWGTALAVLASDEMEPKLWARDSEHLIQMGKDGENKKYLPDIPLTNIDFQKDLNIAMDSDIILLAVPMSGLRALCESIKDKAADKIFVLLSKGVEASSFKLAHNIVEEILPSSAKLVTLSGPSHAEETARRMPTVVTVASTEEDAAKAVQIAFSRPTFRVYTNTDINGVEIGGAIKNIIAIAAGISVGLGYGDNALSALMTRGLIEINKVGKYFGAKPETLYGLAGLGDMITTCMSPYSRNRRVGEGLGKGKTWPQIKEEMVMVAEGVPTVQAVYDLSLKEKLDCPITESVYKVIFENKQPKEAVMELMTRQMKSEV